MLRRLLKYDLRSTLRQFAFIWPAALAVALVGGLLLPEDDPLSISNRVGVAVQTVFVLLLTAMLVLTVVHIVRRFYQGLLGDEGYLMHTLPVEPWLLVLSKLLCALLALAVSVLVAAAAYCLLFSRWVDLSALSSAVSLPSETLLTDDPGPLTLLSLLACSLVWLLFRAVRSILMLYLAMTLGHLVRRHPVAASAAFWVGLNALVSAVTSYLQRMPVGIVYGKVEPSIVVQMRMSFRQSLLRGAALELVLAALFLLIISRVMTYKLELE